ncbi:MAG: YdbH domain-containing protein, partial [bacterium]
GEIPLQITTDGKAARVSAAINPPGSALSATALLSASFATKALAVSATIPSAAIAENDPLLAPFLPASLKSATFSGRVGGRADVNWKPGGEPQGSAEMKLSGGKFATADARFDVEGVECALKFESLAPLRSRPSQKLKFALAHAAGTSLTDGSFVFRFDPPETIFIEHGAFGWCGGKLSCAAARIVGGQPDGMVLLRAEQVDIGQLAGLAPEFGGHTEGWLTGRVPILFGTNGVRLGNVHLIGDPDKPGLLQLDPGKWPGNQVDTLGVSPTVKKAMKDTLRNMSLNLLRIDALPKTDKTSTRLCLRIAGTPREDTDLPPVDLTINLNVEDRRSLLWNLLNQSR